MAASRKGKYSSFLLLNCFTSSLVFSSSIDLLVDLPEFIVVGGPEISAISGFSNFLEYIFINFHGHVSGYGPSKHILHGNGALPVVPTPMV